MTIKKKSKKKINKVEINIAFSEKIEYIIKVVNKSSTNQTKEKK